MKIANFNLAENRIFHVPLGASINTYITAATAGDTLVLASGTYTVTAAIAVSKALTIIGQGVNRTVIACATNTVKIFNITASNVSIRDLAVTYTAADSGGCFGIFADGTAAAVLTNVNITDVNVSITGASTSGSAGIAYDDAGGTVRDCNIVATHTGGTWIGMRNITRASAEAACTVIAQRVISTILGTGATASYAFSVQGASATQNAVMNLYDCIGTASGATTTAALHTLEATSFAYARNCTLSGGSQDVRQVNSSTLSLIDTNMVNGTVSGTITYGGNYVSAKLGVGGAPGTSLIKSYGDIEAAAAGNIYFGDPATNDSWRIVRSGNNLVIERRESGSWVTKSTISA